MLSAILLESMDHYDGTSTPKHKSRSALRPTKKKKKKKIGGRNRVDDLTVRGESQHGYILNGQPMVLESTESGLADGHSGAGLVISLVCGTSHPSTSLLHHRPLGLATSYLTYYNVF